MIFNINKYASDKIAAIEDSGKSITYGELCTFADEFKKYVEQRSLIFILCRNSIGSFAGYTACLSDRIVPVLLDASLEDNLFQNLFDLYKPEYIWIPQNRILNVATEEVYSKYDYKLLYTSNKSPKTDDDLAVLITTSGSTGSPKLVKQSYKNIYSNTKSITEYLKICESDRPITTLPMNYTYGLSIIQSHLFMGATLLMTDKTLMEKGFWTFLKEQNATTFGGVPYTYSMLKRLRFFNMDIPSLKYLTQAGGKLGYEMHLEFAQKCKEKGMDFIVMYGQTEATARMSYVPAEKAEEKAGSIGIAVPGGAFSLIDIDGKEITKSDVVGELVYHGDNVTLGYAQAVEDLCKGDERNGMLVTGDMAKFDDDGYYYIVGRKKRFLKLFGNRVNLDEAESLLTKAGFESVCTGVDDNMKIFTTSTDTDAALKAIVLITGLNRSAFSVSHIDKIPRNESGKIMYSKLESDNEA